MAQLACHYGHWDLQVCRDITSFLSSCLASVRLDSYYANIKVLGITGFGRYGKNHSSGRPVKHAVFSAIGLLSPILLEAAAYQMTRKRMV